MAHSVLYILDWLVYEPPGSAGCWCCNSVLQRL